MKIKIVSLIIFIYSGILFLCLSNNSTRIAFAQSDSCTDGQSLVIDTVNKRYKCITINSGGLGSGGNVNMTVANASSTGTTVNRLAKLTGAPSTALITSTSDTENAIGVVTSGAGTTGSAVIAILGQVSCDFDNATTAGNYVTISAITAGKCHDAGSSYPTSGAAYGRVLTTNGASGTFSMELMTPDIAFQNGGNGKSRPGGSDTQFQYNNNNQFGGTSGLAWDSTNKKLTFAQGTITTSQPWLTFTNTLNASGVTFSGLVINTTDTASAIGTKLIDLQVGGTSQVTFQRVSNPQYALTIPNGSNSRPGLSFTSDTTTGISGGSNIEFNVSGGVAFRVNSGDIHIIPSGGIEQRNGGPYRWQSSTRILSVSNANLRVDGNSDNTAGVSITLGDSGGTAGVRLKRNAAVMEARLSDDSAYTTFAASSFKTGANTIYSSGTPSIAGNATLNTNSKDSAGKITSTGTGASTAVLTFSVAFNNAPACIVTNETTSNLVRPVSTTTTLTVNATVVTGDSISYICVGY